MLFKFDERSEEEADTSEKWENKEDLGYLRHAFYSFLIYLHTRNWGETAGVAIK
jgi:hypothetical protein